MDIETTLQKKNQLIKIEPIESHSLIRFGIDPKEENVTIRSLCYAGRDLRNGNYCFDLFYRVGFAKHVVVDGSRLWLFLNEFTKFRYEHDFTDFS